MVRIDRGFAAQPPACIAELAQAEVSGESWGEASVNLAGDIRRRDVCLQQVNAWLASEREARAGAPNS